MIVFEQRACTILWNVLRCAADRRPFLLPANVCPIVPITFLEAKQPFELVDIAEPWWEIDGAECLARLESDRARYAGLLFVRPYGSERRPDAFFAQLRAVRPDLLIIDDKCLCAPHCESDSVSPYADVTLFSTGYAKYVDLGGGGFAQLADSVRYESGRREFSPEALAAVTERCDNAIAAREPFGELPAGWLDSREPEAWGEHRRRMLAGLASAGEQKRRLNEIYARMLPPEIQLPSELQAWRFNIRVPDPERLIEASFAEGLFASRHYAPLGGVFGSGVFPVAARLHAEIVNLFNDRYFDESRAAQMSELVLRHIGRL
jgi:hypothetical protein